MFRPITKVLKKGIKAAGEDQKRFNAYSKGLITLEECMDWFFYNNNVRQQDREKITAELFKAWLYTEGYGMR